MKRWWQGIRRRFAALGNVLLAGFFVFSCIFALLICCVGMPWMLWEVFIGEPRKKAEKKAEEKEAWRQGEQRGREARRKAAGATWANYPGLTDLVGFDGLDPALVPESERYPWQPEG